MDPLGATSSWLHGSTLLRTQQTLGLNAKRAGPAQPAAFWHLQDSVACLWGNKTWEGCEFLLLFSCLRVASPSFRTVLYGIANTTDTSSCGESQHAFRNVANLITHSFPRKIRCHDQLLGKNHCPRHLGKRKKCVCQPKHQGDS